MDSNILNVYKYPIAMGASDYRIIYRNLCSEEVWNYLSCLIARPQPPWTNGVAYVDITKIKEIKLIFDVTIRDFNFDPSIHYNRNNKYY